MKSSDARNRSTKLAAKLPKNAVAILTAADVKYRSGAVFYEFHQESNFYYLTGKTVPHIHRLIDLKKCQVLMNQKQSL